MTDYATRSLRHLILVYGAALLITGLIWPLLTLAIGPNIYPSWISLALLGLTGYWGIRQEGLTLTEVGFSGQQLLRAVMILGAAYGLFLLGLVLLGFPDPLLRTPTLIGLFDNWLLTGGGEELLFRGFILIALLRLCREIESRLPWRAVLISSLLFSLFHLPSALFGYSNGMNLLMDLAIPFVSSLVVFGPLYLLSGNLWLVALVHGVTNYPIVPQIKDNPLLGLLFMALVMALGWFARSRQATAVQAVRQA